VPRNEHAKKDRVLPAKKRKSPPGKGGLVFFQAVELFSELFSKVWKKQQAETHLFPMLGKAV